jgi:transposase-like protein
MNGGINEHNKYRCEKCGEGFRIKYNFNRHKGDCITYKKVIKMLEVENEINNKDIKTLR